MIARTSDETGSLTLELVVLAPAVLLLLGLVIAGGRAAIASQAVAQAASQAAREASLQSTPAAAASTARSRVESVLAGQDLQCEPASVSVDARALRSRPGTPGKVTVSVGCSVPWSDLGIPGAPGSRTLTSTGTAPIDTWTTR